MFNPFESSPDPSVVSGAYQSLEDAWSILLSAKVDDWQGPGAEKAEIRRIELMSRVADARDRMAELHSLATQLQEVEELLAVGAAA